MTEMRAPARELEQIGAVHLAVQRGMVWTGPAMMVIFGVTFTFMARLIPPTSPLWSPDRVVARIAEHPDLFRAGLVITMVGTGLLVPFAAAISAQMRRIEGYNGPLSQTQLICGGLLVIEFIIPIMVWLAAAYRVGDGANPQIVGAFNDLAWLMMVGVVSTVVVQVVAFGIAILIDKRENPIFPRWAGYFMLWVGAMSSPGALCALFKSGPFAWNGLLACWVPFAVFVIWMGVTVWLLLRALDRQVAEEAEAARL